MIDWPTVDVIRGDMRDVLKTYPENSFDSCVTDPPYHLTAGKKGGSGAASSNSDSPAGRSRIGTGFMGKSWDGGDVAFRPETWAEVLRVLKPGAHVAAFSSPRTYHRLTCAIEDAGFEVRDCVFFMFGSGFPKGLDVAKAIDKRRHDRDDVLEVCRWIRERRDAIGLSNGEIDAAFGFNGMAGHWTSVGTQPAVPTLEQVPGLLTVLRIAEPDVPARVRELLVELNGNKGEFGAAWHAREVTGTVEEWADRQAYAITSRDGLRRDIPHSEDAQRWQGWNTNLKPAVEPIVIARKPLPPGWTVVDCVIEHGTGALNVGACRIETGGEGSSTGDRGRSGEQSADARYADKGGTNFAMQPGPRGGDDRGRWPPNVILDEAAAAMVDAQAPSAGAGGQASGPTLENAYNGSVAFGARRGTSRAAPFYEDGGGASRFFYTTKAGTDERWEYLSCDCEAPIFPAWANADRNQNDLTDSTSPKRDISADSSTDDCSSSTSSFGSARTGQFPTVSKSTTSTKSKPTTGSKTSGSLATPNTSESIQDANSATALGGSLATDQTDAASSSQSTPSTGIYPPKGGRSTGVAVPVTLRKSFETSDCGACGKPLKITAHPTVKGLDLMRWVIRLITPPAGKIIEPFAGSGSTLCAAMLEGFGATGIDLDTDEATGEPLGYTDIAQARANYWRGEAMRLAEGGARPPVEPDRVQGDMFG